MKRILALYDAMAENKDTEQFLYSRCESDDERVILVFLDTLRGGSAETVKLYARYIVGFINFMEKPFYQSTTLELAAYLRTFRTVRTQNTVLAGLKSFYNAAHTLGMIRINPTRFFRIRRIRRIERATEVTVRAIPKKDLETLKYYLSGKVSSRNLAIIFVLSQMGLRASELCGLDWKSLRTLDGVRVLDIAGKGKKRRIVRVPEPTLHVLFAYLKAEYSVLQDDIPEEILHLPLFSRRGNKTARLTRQAIYRLVVRACARAGIDRRSPHAFRHFWASFLHHNGVSLSDIQREAGHESIETTAVYVDAGKIFAGASAKVFDSVKDR